ncbi:MAG: glycosyltransferase family A protein [Carnobacterium sp.]|uniref:glycosyltransferase family 2 protein n=1 Tax=Carnobacterium sp. TaxID=48221 RepID=UPI00331548FB
MDTLISVIVPVFNAEDHLMRTITSILNQTYSHLELILIDDGSTDRSFQICQQYKKTDHRIRVIQQENSGVSVARNVGIDASVGELLIFVDSDDYIEENMMEVLISCSSESNELVVYGYYIHNLDKGNEVLLNSGNRENKKITVAEMVSDFWRYYESGVTNSPWNKLYVSSIIKENQIYFPVGVKLGEDVVFNLNYFNQISHIKVIDKYLYHYLLYPNQSTRQVNLNISEDMVFFLTQIESFIQHYNGFKSHPKNLEHHQQQLYKHMLTALKMAYQTNQITRQERLKYVEKTVILFNTVFQNEMDFPQNKFDKLMVHHLKDHNYRKIHQLLTITELVKSNTKRLKNNKRIGGKM